MQGLDLDGNEVVARGRRAARPGVPARARPPRRRAAARPPRTRRAQASDAGAARAGHARPDAGWSAARAVTHEPVATACGSSSSARRRTPSRRCRRSSPPATTSRSWSPNPTAVVRAARAPIRRRCASRRTSSGLAVRTPEKAREIVDETRASGAELGVVVAFGQLLPTALLDALPSGFVNLHFSLLPRWRGAAPVERALLAGDAETGVCLMQLEAGSRHRTGVCAAHASRSADATPRGSCAPASSTSGTRLLVEHLPDVPGAEPVPQVGEPTYADKLTVEEFELDPLRAGDRARPDRAGGQSASRRVDARRRAAREGVARPPGARPATPSRARSRPRARSSPPKARSRSTRCSPKASASMPGVGLAGRVARRRARRPVVSASRVIAVDALRTRRGRARTRTSCCPSCCASSRSNRATARSLPISSTARCGGNAPSTISSLACRRVRSRRSIPASAPRCASARTSLRRHLAARRGG